MNKFFKLIFSVFYFLSISFLYSQEPITVTITEDCNPVSGTYNFESTLNGKNNYINQVTDTDTGEIINIQVGFDGVKWVLYIDDDITDIGFYNLNIPNSLLPPNTGWVVLDCDNGTMLLDGGSTTSLNANILDTTLNIYPNPSNEQFIINTNIISNDIHVDIINMLGISVKKIIINNPKTTINTIDWEKGLYYIKLTYHNSTTKIVKILIK